MNIKKKFYKFICKDRVGYLGNAVFVISKESMMLGIDFLKRRVGKSLSLKPRQIRDI